MTKPHKFTLPFLKFEQVAQNTYSFYFDRTGTNFDFLPGQYIHMTLPHPKSDDRGTSRYFTIASSPLEKDYLMVTTKMLQSTFKEMLHSLKKGQEVQFFGPMGWFLQEEDAKLDKVFIAGGIGITPFHSLLQTVREQTLPHHMTLIALFSKKEDAIFVNKLKEIARHNPRIDVVYSFSHEETGRISEALIKKYVKDIHRPKYYVVGSMGMVEATKAVLKAMGIDDEMLFTEDFTGY